MTDEAKQSDDQRNTAGEDMGRTEKETMTAGASIKEDADNGPAPEDATGKGKARKKRTAARKETASRYERGTRSYTMSRIRGKDTSIEVMVRRYLFRQGLRFRKNDKRYPGHPDVVLPKYRTIVFVNGCFWHMHEGCGRHSTPKSNVEFWTAKLTRNRERDRLQRAALEADGWRVITVWECELRKPVREERLARLYHQIVGDGAETTMEDVMADACVTDVCATDVCATDVCATDVCEMDVCGTEDRMTAKHMDEEQAAEATPAVESAQGMKTTRVADVEIRAYDRLPDEARDIRERVFVVERDYRPEFDEWDAASTHLLAFVDGQAAGTCRFYQDADRPGSGTGDGSGTSGARRVDADALDADGASAGDSPVAGIVGSTGEDAGAKRMALAEGTLTEGILTEGNGVMQSAGDSETDAADWYVIARLAVLPQWRGRHIGAMLLREAERRIAGRGGRVAAVHVEDKNYPFYERFGYTLTDDVYEGGQHGWMVKTLAGEPVTTPGTPGD